MIKNFHETETVNIHFASYLLNRRLDKNKKTGNHKKIPRKKLNTKTPKQTSSVSFSPPQIFHAFRCQKQQKQYQQQNIIYCCHSFYILIYNFPIILTCCKYSIIYWNNKFLFFLQIQQRWLLSNCLSGVPEGGVSKLFHIQ